MKVLGRIMGVFEKGWSLLGHPKTIISLRMPPLNLK